MKIAFFDTKPYDLIWFKPLSQKYGYKIKFFEHRLTADTAVLAKGYDVVCIFVNDECGPDVINSLYENEVKLIALRCAGYNNVDFKEAYKKIHLVRVPDYSPYAVAEHAMALLLSVNRKTYRAYTRTRDNNFSINGLMGVDLHGKTAGVIGTGKIGRIFYDICKGFGMEMLCCDPYPVDSPEYNYVPLKELIRRSDVISLHCPLTDKTHYMINEESIRQMKPGVMIINTSRGALIDTEALIDGLKAEKIGGAGLDVYEEESQYFFEDYSSQIVYDDTLSRLITFPNVLVTSHQAFFTKEAMENIAITTMQNMKAFESGDYLENEICYQCEKFGKCDKRKKREKCF